LDKAVADLTTFLEDGLPNDHDGMCMDNYHPAYWAYLLRAAIRVRQGKIGKDLGDLAMAVQDAGDAARTYRGPEAYSLLAYLYEKGGFPRDWAAKIRELAKRDVQEPPKCEGVEANFAAAFRDCVMKLVPEIEKN
jgi:hypothetical protein